MMTIDGLQVSDAVPMDDGSLTTTLIDANGQIVGTVTRLNDGTSTASVDPNTEDDGGQGINWQDTLGKVTGFLDNLAKQARATSDEAQRIANAARGAITGAQVGYRAPVDLKPILIGAGVLVGVIVIANMVKPSRASRR
jgi:hypothetical protein